MRLKNTPLKDGFTMPAEWEKHSGTIVLLPYREDTWENGGKDAMPEFLEIVKAISLYERVILVINPKIKEEDIEAFKIENVEILRLPYNDSWARDNTLIFVTNNEGDVRAVDFGFNAWGGSVDGLYEDYEDDNSLGARLADFLGVDYYSRKDFILEGGSIHTNGQRVLMTTEACLLSKGRNPYLSKQGIEVTLKDYLGMRHIVWLPHGIVNDETNEHIDNFACFLDEQTILLANTLDEHDLQHQYSYEGLEVLGKLPFYVIMSKLPTPYLTLTKEEASKISQAPGAKPRKEGDRLAASYVNFYQGEKFVLVPQFGVEEDKSAIRLFKQIYPDKTIYPINSRHILVAGGNIHCVTMQIPEGVVKNED